ncbi:hypothetical protein GCM10009120_51240 [Sphingobacterium siyangense subsp. cladoniae]|uniref:FecR family protein n=1 Tax=Sphingobacterium siyangense TaxID=459529 RepID=UPI0031F899F6
MENKEHIKQLFSKYLSGHYTKDELDKLLDYFGIEDKNHDLRELIEAEFDSPIDLSVYESEIAEVDRSVRYSLKRKIYPVATSRFTFYRIAAGIAAVLVLTLTAIYFTHLYSPTKNGQGLVNTANDIAPGKNVATLTLANGKTITLSDAKSGVVIKASALTYSDGTAIENIKIKGSEISTISTPRGGQYNIELPDGTTVALNAASTLKFPSSFSGLVNRRVELAGEGYFEVAPDKKHPFIVKTGEQTIEVLGTHFNINSYDDEPVIKTTLLEGSVKVATYVKGNSAQALGGSTILKPGQQAQLGNDGKLHTTEVNTKEVVAWKDGKFVFKDETLGSIMRKISRWYNVDIIYQGISPEETFWGSISKFENVSKVLEKLELTGGVHFKIEGRKIYVTR